MRTLIAIAPLLVVLPSLGQQPSRSDSLLTILSDQRPDTNRVWTLYELSISERMQDPVAAMRHVREGLKLAEDLGYDKCAGKMWSSLANTQRVMCGMEGDERWRDSSVASSKKSIEAYISRSDSLGAALALMNLGITYSSVKDLLALQTLVRAQSFFTRTVRERADAKDSLNMSKYQRILLNLLGESYLHLGRFDEAKPFLEESYLLAKQSDSRFDLANARDNLKILYQQLGEPREALRVELEQLDASRSMNAAHALGESLLAVASIYQSLNMCDSALYYIAEARRLRRTAVEESTSQNATGTQSKLSIIEAICLATIGRRSEALSLLQGVAQRIDSFDTRDRQVSHEKMAMAYKILGSYEEALRHTDLAVDLRDSLFNERDRSLGAQWQEIYATSEKDRRIKELQQEALIERLTEEKRRVRLLAVNIGAVTALVLGGLLFAFDRKRRQARFEKEAATLETQALRSQMNPHFIFNALNSINAYVQRNDQDKASGFLTKFAKVMRSVLENSRHAEVPLRDDLDTLRAYMELERQRSEEKFDFTISVAEDIDPDDVLVPPLVVQPFVENAIWHGMAGKADKGHITLKVERRGKQLVYTIEDDGAGRQAPKAAQPEGVPTKKTSLGTAITRARLDLVQKQHGGQAAFHYTDLPQGTRVEVEMPMLLAS